MQLPDPALLAGLYLVSVNTVCWLLFWHDKRAARLQRWRVPERLLLFWALMGGSIGAKTAQHRLRHKTRKEPFRTILNRILILHVLLVAAGVILPVPLLRETAAELTVTVLTLIASALPLPGA